MNSVKQAETLIRERTRKIRANWRKLITGDDKKRIRDLIKDKRKEPVYIKFFDKMAFTMGVMNMCICQYFLLSQPQHMWVWHTIAVGLLVGARVPIYNIKGMGYFLIDFCYVVNLATFVYLYVLTENETLFKVTFIHSFGPLIWAIPLWGNSVVFHDYDKITSVYIHMLPPALCYAELWYGSMQGCSPLEPMDFVWAVAGYLVWQVLYFMKTEVVDKRKLDENPHLLTSLRWLSNAKRNSTNRAVLAFCRDIGLYGKDEDFDHRDLKTKAVFMGTQLLYTLCSVAPVLIWFQYRLVSLWFIVFIFVLGVFNGASYYIEIFSSRYQLKFNRDDTAKVAQAAAEVAIEVVRRRRRSEADLAHAVVYSAEVQALQAKRKKVDPEDDLYDLYTEQLEELMTKEDQAHREKQESLKTNRPSASTIGDDGNSSTDTRNGADTENGHRAGTENKEGDGGGRSEEWIGLEERQLIEAATEVFVDEYASTYDLAGQRLRASSGSDSVSSADARVAGTEDGDDDEAGADGSVGLSLDVDDGDRDTVAVEPRQRQPDRAKKESQVAPAPNGEVGSD